MKFTFFAALLGGILLASPSQAAWQRLGGINKRPVNQADPAIAGAKIASSQGIGQPENFIQTEDPTAASKLPAGTSDVVVSLGRQTVSNLMMFVNDGTEGRVSISASGDQTNWTPVAQSVFTSADRSISINFAGAQAKYIKLDFDLSKAGTVRSLAIYGAETDYDFKVRDSAASPGPMNVAGGIGGSRVIYVHPAPIGGDELAEKYNKFDFPESSDKYRTVIYDLGQPRTLTEIGSVHSPRPVRVVAYTFETLPEKEDWRHRRSFDPAVFETMKPVATVEDSRGVGYIKARLVKSVRARYIALRWEPDFNPPSFTVNSCSVSASGLSGASFEPGAGGPGVGYNGPNGANGNNGSGNASGAGGAGGDGAAASGSGAFSAPVLGAPVSRSPIQTNGGNGAGIGPTSP